MKIQLSDPTAGLVKKYCRSLVFVIFPFHLEMGIWKNGSCFGFGKALLMKFLAA